MLLQTYILMRAILGSHLTGKNKGHVTSDTTYHDMCVTEVHVPYFPL